MGEAAEDSARRRRLHHVLNAIGRDGADVDLLPSDSNDAWRLGDVVLRICYRGDPDRFHREALVAAVLPPSVRAPRLLDYGSDAELAWQVRSWVNGIPLGRAWPTLDSADRRPAITQLGEMLAELNAHAFPNAVRAALGTPRPAEAATTTDIIGADLNPLPLARAQLLLDPAARLPGVDRGLLDFLAERFDELGPADPLGAQALSARDGGLVVHGDAHPMNVLWNDGVVALLDWEWVRLGGPELEIEPFLHRGLEAHQSLTDDSRRIMRWLAQAHPEAFAGPDLVRRLWLIDLAYTLRHLLIWPPDRPEHRLPVDHPLRRLRRIASDPGHVERMLPRT